MLDQEVLRKLLDNMVHNKKKNKFYKFTWFRVEVNNFLRFTSCKIEEN